MKDLASRGESTDEDLDDPILEDMLRSREEREKQTGAFDPISARRGGGEDWDAPLDLRAMRPIAIDLRKLWSSTGRAAPASIDAVLGPRIPILLCHEVTPFAIDGRRPGRVWGLGYEFVSGPDVGVNTVGVQPNDETLDVGEIGQDVEVGVSLNGAIALPTQALQLGADAVGFPLPGGKIRASTDQTFQFSLNFEVTLRKIVGARVGVGGALWKLYRQDERLDRPHVLFQTLTVAEGTAEIPCTIKLWAKQAGYFGLEWGSRFWPYEDLHYTISLDGLETAS